MKKLGLAVLSILIFGLAGFSADTAEKKTLILDPQLMLDKGDKIIFEKDSNVMRSSYDKFVFDKKSFLKLLGDYNKWEGAKAVQVTTKLSSFKTLFPKDGAVPQGGFKITYYDTIIVKVLPDPKEDELYE